MIGSVELYLLIIIALIYLAVPLITLWVVFKINQRLKNMEESQKSRPD